MHRADDGVFVKLLSGDQLEDRQTDLFHVFGQVDGEFLPCWERLAAEPARFFLRLNPRLLMAYLHLLPCRVVSSCFFDGRFGLHLGLWELVLADEMLKEVVTSVTDMTAVFDIAGPPLKMAMAFIFVSDPVRLPLEDLWISAAFPGAREWLHIFVHMLGPV